MMGIVMINLTVHLVYYKVFVFSLLSLLLSTCSSNVT
jgi:hypothetical protein